MVELQTNYVNFVPNCWYPSIIRIRIPYEYITIRWTEHTYIALLRIPGTVKNNDGCAEATQRISIDFERQPMNFALAECLNANDGVVYEYEYVYQLFSDLMGVMPELNGALSGFDVAVGKLVSVKV